MLSPTIVPPGMELLLEIDIFPLQLLDSIAFFTRIRVLSRREAFRESVGAEFGGAAAVSIVPWPEIMITSGGLSSWRSFPGFPGRRCRAARCRATPIKSAFAQGSRQASPLSADEAEYPSSVSHAANESRIPASSSTMRMLGMLNTCSGDNNL